MKPKKVSTFQPRLKVLIREQALTIHAAALEILQKTGVKMEHPGASEMVVGIRVNEATLGLDAVKKVGTSGNYVTEDQTIEHVLDEFFYPNHGVRLNFDIWQEAGQPDMLSSARVQVRQILKDDKRDLLARDLIHNTFPGIQNA